jgi:toxin ParE1/3/4
MSQIQIANRARFDLQAIWSYIARSRVRAADRLIKTIVGKFRRLLRFPQMGSLCEELAVGLRCFSVGNYVIFYRPIHEGIEIIRVLHAGQDVRSLFEEH